MSTQSASPVLLATVQTLEECAAAIRARDFGGTGLFQFLPALDFGAQVLKHIGQHGVNDEPVFRSEYMTRDGLETIVMRSGAVYSLVFDAPDDGADVDNGTLRWVAQHIPPLPGTRAAVAAAALSSTENIPA